MSGVPEDALRAARASVTGAAGPLDAVAASLEFTASQLQPSLGNLSAMLGRDLDAPSFAVGMLSGTLAMTGLDIAVLVRDHPVLFAEFIARCEAMQGREVCANHPETYPSITCGLDPGHKGQHGAGRLRW